MEKLKYILLILILSSSCKDLKKDKQAEEFQNKLNTEMANGIRNDTIFLGYTFGMTKSDFQARTKELREEKKLYLNNSNTLVYKMTISDDMFGKDLETTFSPFYFNEQLYELGVSVKPNINSNIQLTQLQLVELFNDKYGFYDYSENSKLTENKDFYWINGNRKIKILAGIKDARIFYTDLIVEKEMEEKQDSEQKKELEKAKSDV